MTAVLYIILYVLLLSQVYTFKCPLTFSSCLFKAEYSLGSDWTPHTRLSSVVFSASCWLHLHPATVLQEGVQQVKLAWQLQTDCCVWRVDSESRLSVAATAPVQRASLEEGKPPMKCFKGGKKWEKPQEERRRRNPWDRRVSEWMTLCSGHKTDHNTSLMLMWTVSGWGGGIRCCSVNSSWIFCGFYICVCIWDTSS